MVYEVCSLRGWVTSVSNRTILVTVRSGTDDVIEGAEGERKIEGPQLFRFQRPSVEGKGAHVSRDLFTSVCCRDQRNQRTKEHACESADRDRRHTPKCEMRSE
jgi:hypothetical protein